MGWYDHVKSYVWDDRTTPYLVPVARLSQPQADREIRTYTVFLALVFIPGTIIALVQAKHQHNTLYYWAAAHAASVVWCAIYLAFTKHPRVALYCMSAPVAALLGFATGTLNPNLRTVETVLLSLFSLLWLRYSLRVVAIARAYLQLSPELPPDLPPSPPGRRRGR
jgi:hypothetical protein